MGEDHASPFRPEPGELRADYLPRLQKANEALIAFGAEELRALAAKRQADRARLRAALETIPDDDDREFAKAAML